ncbi:MAG: PhoH family protein [Clostridiales bacterium]
MELYEDSLKVKNVEHIKNVFGNYDENIDLLRDKLKVEIIQRNDEIKVKGEVKNNVKQSMRIFKKLFEKYAKDYIINKQEVSMLIEMEKSGNIDDVDDFCDDCVCITHKKRIIRAKTSGQSYYVNSIRNNTITFGIGPAGTGKTFLAVALAKNEFKNKDSIINRIIITRPAVEAGEKLGFLPGDLQNKVDPYLRPLHDALFEVMGMEDYNRNLEKNLIEVAPLAYMRGRTLDNSFIILDEAQNTTPEQMKMFLTRLGFNSKIVVTGDVTQIDLPKDKKSGLKVVRKILKNVKGIEFVELTAKDVVRHDMVHKIIEAYDKHENRNGG